MSIHHRPFTGAFTLTSPSPTSINSPSSPSIPLWLSSLNDHIVRPLLTRLNPFRRSISRPATARFRDPSRSWMQMQMHTHVHCAWLRSAAHSGTRSFSTCVKLFTTWCQEFEFELTMHTSHVRLMLRSLLSMFACTSQTGPHGIATRSFGFGWAADVCGTLWNGMLRDINE